MQPDKHVYGSYDGLMGLADTKGKLIYDFDLKEKGSMSIRFKPVVSSTTDRTIINIVKGNQTYSQNLDGSPHDGTDGNPPKSVIKELEKRGWKWNRNFYLTTPIINVEFFPMDIQMPVVEVILPPNVITGSLNPFPIQPDEGTLETIDPPTLPDTTFNPFPLSDEEKEILIIGGIAIIAIAAIALIPATGGSSLFLLLGV
jgi:hypothetical protein